VEKEDINDGCGHRFLGLHLRLFDIFASLILGAPTLIFIGAAAPFVKFTSPGTIFFVQERIGFKGKTLLIPKLRTMEKGKVTSIGKFLRRSGLDELPQLWSVLKGEMSIFGPRPLPKDEVVQEYVQKVLFRRKPGFIGLFAGIMGPAKGRWDMSIHLELEQYEMDNWSFAWAVKLVIMTLMAVLHIYRDISKRFDFFGLSVPVSFKHQQDSESTSFPDNVISIPSELVGFRTLQTEALLSENRIELENPDILANYPGYQRRLNQIIDFLAMQIHGPPAGLQGDSKTVNIIIALDMPETNDGRRPSMTYDSETNTVFINPILLYCLFRDAI